MRPCGYQPIAVQYAVAVKELAGGSEPTKFGTKTSHGRS